MFSVQRCKEKFINCNFKMVFVELFQAFKVIFQNKLGTRTRTRSVRFKLTILSLTLSEDSSRNFFQP